MLCSECLNPKFKLKAKTPNNNKNPNKMPCASKKIDLFSFRIQNTTKRMYSRFYSFVFILFFLMVDSRIKNRGVRNASCCSISTELKFSQSLRHFHTVDGNAVLFGTTAWRDARTCVSYDCTIRTRGVSVWWCTICIWASRREQIKNMSANSIL